MHKAMRSPLIRVLLAVILIASVATPVMAVGHGDKGKPVKRGQSRRPDPPNPPGPPSRTARVNFKGQIHDLPDDPSLIGVWAVLDRVGMMWEVEVTADTRIQPPPSQVAEGDWVQVSGRGDESQRTLIAERIKVERGGEGRARPVEIKGEIEMLPDQSDFIGDWRVDGVTFAVSSETMMHPGKRTPELGMVVNVILFQQPDGSLWAKNIALHAMKGLDDEEPHDEDEIEFTGIIESLPDGSLLGDWEVGGITVVVTADTELKGAVPAVGLWAKVEGVEQQDGSVLAREIKVQGPELEEIEFEGTIVKMTSIPGEWVIEVPSSATGTTEITVMVTADTYIDERLGPAELGAWVQVKAAEQSDGTLLALRIKVKPGPDDDHEVEFEGFIQSLPEGSLLGTWVVGGTRVTVTPYTELKGTVIAVGLWAEVEGLRRPDGSVLATKIDVEEPDEEIEFRGLIESLPSGGLLGDWVVGSTTVAVTSDTELEGAQPAVGLWAEVEGVQRLSGSVLAHHIKVEGPGGAGPFLRPRWDMWQIMIQRMMEAI